MPIFNGWETNAPSGARYEVPSRVPYDQAFLSAVGLTSTNNGIRITDPIPAGQATALITVKWGPVIYEHPVAGTPPLIFPLLMIGTDAAPVPNLVGWIGSPFAMRNAAVAQYAYLGETYTLLTAPETTDFIVVGGDALWVVMSSQPDRWVPPTNAFNFWAVSAFLAPGMLKPPNFP